MIFFSTLQEDIFASSDEQQMAEKHLKVYTKQKSREFSLANGRTCDRGFYHDFFNEY